MKINLFSLVFVLISFSNYSQELNISFSYNAIIFNELDNTIRTYNFNRPFLQNKQSLLHNGFQSSVGYFFNSEKKVKHGFQISYANFQSKASNEDFNNTLKLNFVNIAYAAHYKNFTKFNNLFLQFNLSIKGSSLKREINGSDFYFNESNKYAIGIGSEIGIRCAYSIKILENQSLSPFVEVAYVPFFYAPNNEPLINQTLGLVSNSWSPIFSVQAGISWGIVGSNSLKRKKHS
jgi:hypothetical protein